MNFYRKIKLPYELNELEPLISRNNLDYHYNILHDNYEKKLNEVLLKISSLDLPQKYPLLKDLLINIKTANVPENIRQDISFFGGGLINHDFFFSLLAKNNNFFIDENLLKGIVEYFDSLENLKKKLTESALKIRGSGWTWMVLDKKEMKIINTINQDNPWVYGYKPLIGIDVWEHAFSDYQKFGKRAKEEYLKIILEELLNWEFISNLYLKYSLA